MKGKEEEEWLLGILIQELVRRSKSKWSNRGFFVKERNKKGKKLSDFHGAFNVEDTEGFSFFDCYTRLA